MEVLCICVFPSNITSSRRLGIVIMPSPLISNFPLLSNRYDSIPLCPCNVLLFGRSSELFTWAASYLFVIRKPHTTLLVVLIYQLELSCDFICIREASVSLTYLGYHYFVVFLIYLRAIVPVYDVWITHASTCSFTFPLVFVYLCG